MHVAMQQSLSPLYELGLQRPRLLRVRLLTSMSFRVRYAMLLLQMHFHSISLFSAASLVADGLLYSVGLMGSA